MLRVCESVLAKAHILLAAAVARCAGLRMLRCCAFCAWRSVGQTPCLSMQIGSTTVSARLVYYKYLYQLIMRHVAGNPISFVHTAAVACCVHWQPGIREQLRSGGFHASCLLLCCSCIVSAGQSMCTCIHRRAIGLQNWLRC